MGFGEWVAKTFAKSSTDIITNLADAADKFITTGEEKQAFQLEVMNAQMEQKKLNMSLEEMYMKDRQSARDMYMKDSSLQKIFAIVFLVGYLVLSISMVMMVFGFIFKVGPATELSAFEASIISMVFTAMSTKVNTIVDFLFGGSQGQNNSEQRMADTFAAKATEK